MANYSALLSAISEQKDLSTMKRLSEVKTKQQKERLEKEGYCFGFTATEWRKKYPLIPARNIFCTRAVALPSELVYYDRDRYIFLNTFIYNGIPLFHAKDFEEYFCDVIKKSEKNYSEKKYHALLSPLLSEESGNTALYILNDMLEREPPSKDLYSLAISAYSFCNGGVDKLSKLALQNMIIGKSEEQKTETRKALREIIQDPVTIYRGVGSKSASLKSALSWTLDINTAYFFAGWRGQGGGSVYTAKVRQENIIEYINSRKEQEVIVLPEHVLDCEKKNMLLVDLFIELISTSGFSEDKRFHSASNPNYIRDTIRKVYQNHGKNISDHDCNHSIRVALLASFLYRMDVLSSVKRSKTKFDRANAIYEKLLTAITYHDIGRKDNSANETHGKTGYTRYLNDGNKDDEIIKFLTEYHCVDSDESARRYWKTCFENHNDADDIWAAYRIMRDADALDRVRFGRGCNDYLDIGLLRSETGKALVPVAMYLVNSKI